MRSALALLALAALATPGKAQTLPVGEPAPKLQNLRWIGPTPPALEKGKVTVLEFWATWCTPCLAAFPHLNRLVEESKGEPFVFVSITNDTEAKVRALLKTRELKTSVALDPDDRAFRLYGAAMIPHTVIVGPDGNVAAVTRPDLVTLEVLRNVAAGRDPGLPKPDALEPTLAWDAKGDLLTEDTLGLSVLRSSEATSSVQSVNPKTGRIVADGASLLGLLILAYGAEASPVRGSVATDSGRYRVSIKAPDKSLETARAMLRTLVESSFPYRARWETVEREAPVLRRGPGPLKLTPSTATATSGYTRDGHLEGKGATMEWLALRLGLAVSDVAGKDETGLSGRFDVVLDWESENRASLRGALKAIGLDFPDVRRGVPTLVVESTAK